MKTHFVHWLALGFGVCLPLVLAADSPPAPAQDRAAAEKAFSSGNFKVAYDQFRALVLDPKADPIRVGGDLRKAVDSLNRLGRVDEIDELLEKALAVHPDNPKVLSAAAEIVLHEPHHGVIIAGEFKRGNPRQQGNYVNSSERDRTRAMQLLLRAIEKGGDDRKQLAADWLSLADVFEGSTFGQPSWRLQTLTDLATLPDYEEGWNAYGGRGAQGAPVDAEGMPVLYHMPKAFTDAKNDGERWRWALAQAAELNAGLLDDTRMRWAQFLHSQFGVQTMLANGPFGMPAEDDAKPDEDGPFAVHTLKENETIARLATGVKRFALDDEFNAIKIYQTIAADPKSRLNETAIARLGQIFEDRRQYPRAAEYCEQNNRLHPNVIHQQRLDQIVKPWGRFEPTPGQAAGTGASIDFRFRNGKSVQFDAWELDVDRLLGDLKLYLKSNPKQLDWNKLQIGQIGHRIIEQNERQYLKAKVASWSLDLDPRPNHFDRDITVAAPLQKAGAYLVTAQIAGGNTTRIVLWLNDTVIVKKPLPGKTWCFVADAVSGQPIPKANVEFFGWTARHERENAGTRMFIDTKDFAEFTNADGQLSVAANQDEMRYQWMIVARTPKGRLAHLGFTSIWSQPRVAQNYDAQKVYVITDRPVYRPKQSVKFKVWVRRARYDEDGSEFGDKEFLVEITNPKGEKVLGQRFKTDRYGGLMGELELASDAALGVYSVSIPDHGGGTFRVEEYKKPEFMVSVDAPAEPVKLGDKFKAKINASYYFGGPVSKAKVHYKVTRTAVTDRWFPPGPWDWLFGAGYWWFGVDYDWYPGFAKWGCRRPLPFWWPMPHQPPEVVADAEVEIGADGSVPVVIDTAFAKSAHGNQDHRYEITAEVTDLSRRTIVGTGAVSAAREPFRVTVWINRGYVHIGDPIEVSVRAQTVDHKPVKGDGKLRLLKITYDANGKPAEAEVNSWKLAVNEDGAAAETLKASEPGQYRLSSVVTDAQGHSIEGGYVFQVVGQGFDGSAFRFNDLELVADSREYAPGQEAKLMINTNRTGSTVLLFAKPVGGSYSTPKTLRLGSKSTIEPIAIAKGDMPNVFVEAVTVSGGRVFTEVRELAVPPEKRVLDVEVLPSKTTYKPGQKASVKLKLTDFEGKPFAGTTVLSVYDKSVEYISGGSNVPEIRAFFWKWKRSHHPHDESSFPGDSYPVQKQNEVTMDTLGVFGALDDDSNELGLRGNGKAKSTRFAAALGAAPGRAGAMRGMAGGMGGARLEEMAAPMMDKAGAPMEGAAEFDSGLDRSPEAAQQQPAVRKNFADTAYWTGTLDTAADGTAEVAFDLPESLTTWKMKWWALGEGTRVGQGEAEVVTTKDLLVRLQAPRFFVEKDEVVLSANVRNNYERKLAVQVALELDGGKLLALDEATRRVEIGPKDEKRIDFRVGAVAEGQAIVRLRALSDEESDALEMNYPVYVHGMLKTETWSLALRPEDASKSFEIKVPAERRPAETKLEIRYSPTLAGALVDSLPYLADYPYGCTEQTLNRFLPTVVTQKILQRMGLDLAAIRDKRANLNAQEIGDPKDRAKQWKRFDRNPVFDQAEVAAMVRDGVERLTEMQLSDGGWGWFMGFGERSDPHMTAIVVHGLRLAAKNDVAIVPDVITRGVQWLKRYQADQNRRLRNFATKTVPYKEKADALDALADRVLAEAGFKDDAMRDFLYRDRIDLPVYAKALFGLALFERGDRERLAMIMENIRQFVVMDDENQTAYLKLPNQGYWWFWFGDEIEADAAYLQLLARTDPKGPIASRLVKYLINNRKHATYWNSTRDTAQCVEALAEYLAASGESKPDLTLKVLVDGQVKKEVKITSENLFTFDDRVILAGDALADGKHTVEFQKTGASPLYANAYLTNFTLEDPITRAGLEVKVDRKVYRLIRDDKAVNVEGAKGQVVSQRVEKYRRELIDGDTKLKSGELVEVELEIDSKNDYEYLIFEDFKAAGCEPVSVRSGYDGNSLGAYVEFRDERVAFFIRRLARGKHSVSYRLRAEIPGKFSALPARAWAMYAPELKGNSDEQKLRIED